MNFRRVSQDDARRMLGDRVFFASVDSTSGGLVKIRRDGQTAADGQFYPAAEGLAATVSAGDRVMCVVDGGVPHVVAAFVYS